MAKVRLEVMPWLGETLGMAKTSEETLEPDATNGQESVRNLLNRISTRYQGFDLLVFDNQTQRLTGKVAIFLNGRDLDLGDGLETRLKDGDALSFVPLIVGG